MTRAPLFRLALFRLGESEYEIVLGVANALREVMERQWNWAPNDLWDVQSVIWVTRSDPEATDDAAS